MILRWTRIARREYDDAFAGLFDGRHHRRDSDGEFREVVVGRYRFIYRVTPDLVEIRRVRHVRRDYDPMRIRDGAPSGSPAFVPV